MLLSSILSIFVQLQVNLKITYILWCLLLIIDRANELSFITGPAWIVAACTLPINLIHIPLITLRCFFFSSFARLFAHDVSRHASKHVSEPVLRLQNELFLALRMLRRRECRKDSRCYVDIWKAWKSVQAKIPHYHLLLYR